MTTFDDFAELVDHYLAQKAVDEAELFFWNFGCENWVLAASILDEDNLESRSFGIPRFPDSPPTIHLADDDEGFKVVEYADSPQAKAPPSPSLKAIPQVPEKEPLPPPPEEDYSQKRKFKRYLVRFKVIISNQQKTFLSYSKNISEGGILLEDRIPKYMFNEKSEVYISSPNKKEIIVFRCLPFGEDENPNRLLFQQSQASHLEKLRLWLETSQ